MDSSGNPHICYYDETNKNLKYAKWTGTSWSVQNLEPAGSGYDVGCLALDSNNVPHVLYSKWSGGQLRYAVLNGSTWNIHTISQPSWVDSPGITFDKFGNLHIIFRSELVLKYAKLVGSSWNITTVDRNGLNGFGNSLTTDINGNPHISYIGIGEGDTQTLRYAKWTGSTWNTQVVDSTGICFYSSITLDSNGNPHISYSYKSNQTTFLQSLKYAKWTGTEWNILAVNSASNTGYFSSIITGSSNNPQICYEDWEGMGSLKYANWTGTTWNIQTVDTASNARLGAMVLHSTGNPRVTYSSETGLKYAELLNPEVTSPIPEFTAIVMLAAVLLATGTAIMVKLEKRSARQNYNR